MAPEKYEILSCYNLCSLMAILKVWNSRTNSTVTLFENPNGSFSTLRNLFGDVSDSKNHTQPLVRNIFNFLPQPPSVIPWLHCKYHNFPTSFPFLRIFKSLGDICSWSSIRKMKGEKNVNKMLFALNNA